MQPYEIPVRPGSTRALTSNLFLTFANLDMTFKPSL